MKLIFFHNTLPEYRVGFFQKLSLKIDTTYVITQENLQNKIYQTTSHINKLGNLKVYNLKPGLSGFALVRKLFQETQFDAVVLPPLDDLLGFFQGLFIQQVAKGKKIIYWSEKWEAPRNKQPAKKQIKNFLQRQAFRLISIQVSLFIVSGSKAYGFLVDQLKIKPNKITVSYDASEIDLLVNQPDIRKEYVIPPEAKIILYFGRIIQRKGLDLLIEAFVSVSHNKPNTYLLICGDGDFESSCRKLVIEKNLHNVKFAGRIEPEFKHPYFSQSDVFVLPSFFWKGIPEAWGLTINESLQAGVPVITTTATGGAYDLIDGSNGLMVEENNSAELAKAILNILDDNNTQQLRIKCKMTAAKFSFDTMAEEFSAAIVGRK